MKTAVLAVLIAVPYLAAQPIPVTVR